MATLAPLTWIGNAAAVLTGPWGAVTAQAQQAGCSRQVAYTHAQRVQTAVAEAQAGGPSRAQLQAEGQQLREENRQLWAALADTIAFGEAAQRRFAGTAAALGLSLNQTRALLTCVLPSDACPSRATLDRWLAALAARARQVLTCLDRACQPVVETLCLDEIFCHRLPILMAVEPYSLAWLLGQRGPDRSGATWQQALAAWPQVQYVATDNGSGLQHGLEAIQQQRQQAGNELALEVELDVFHTRREGAQALRREWAAAERLWEQAEQADRDLAQAQRQGQDRRGRTLVAWQAWQRAERAFEQACRREAAWQRASQALDLFRPDGRLNDRAWAEGQIQTAVPDLEGPRWAKVRRMLTDRRSLTFLDRVHRDLEAAVPRAELRAALVALWRLRHATRPGCGPKPGAVTGVVLPVLQALIAGRLEREWHGAYQRVARVLSRVVRASSVVECLNSIVRRHQARHRTLSQPLLDLKRLYWNCRAFLEGQRKEHCPYEHLGLELPSYDWWDLLHTEPHELEQKVSSRPQAA